MVSVHASGPIPSRRQDEARSCLEPGLPGGPTIRHLPGRSVHPPAVGRLAQPYPTGRPEKRAYPDGPGCHRLVPWCLLHIRVRWNKSGPQAADGRLGAHRLRRLFRPNRPEEPDHAQPLGHLSGLRRPHAGNRFLHGQLHGELLEVLRVSHPVPIQTPAAPAQRHHGLATGQTERQTGTQTTDLRKQERAAGRSAQPRQPSESSSEG